MLVSDKQLAAGQDMIKDLPNFALGQGYDKIVYIYFETSYLLSNVCARPTFWTHIVISQTGDVGQTCSSGF